MALDWPARRRAPGYHHAWPARRTARRGGGAGGAMGGHGGMGAMGSEIQNRLCIIRTWFPLEIL